ncbi:MAG: hypothetical protein N2044_08875 [Cyclobacteriaceae bacterium]|nr:hypothetical protein [Cyclobacteriaceae bacterium]MCX7637943.1 hypothetical protein [Cyclobacteriaceae bacterium]MDW8332173.1 hypothetical protein [Cyclobacteriaceae bacterium]
MSSLSKDWLTQGLIDFEYKKYVLLAYLQKVKESFGRVELYPFLSELVFHYQNLKAVQENRTLIREQFPRELSLEDFRKLVLSYRQMVEDDAVMNELSSIIEFAIPQVKESLDEGTVIYEYVESQCEFTAVGVTPLYAREGYLFVTQPPEEETNIYRYQLSIYEERHEQLRSLNTKYIETASKSPFEPYENLKLSLTRRFSDLPNPATYLVLSRIRFPFTATLMPVAKRLLVKHLSTAA